ncbi:MAG: heme utilization protein, partial [Hydrococcus sp. RM1_1_31]|nr:heme utilization protein [Hydrococcus sp. RM1_1_31]
MAQIESFPLDLLNIYPGEEYGIIGELSGQLQANLAVNLNTLTGSGDISIDNPRVGYREAKSFNASLSYNNNIARLNSAVLELENSSYEGQGAINLTSGAIEGRLEADKGYVQDVLAALQIYDIPTLIDFFRFEQPDFANAEQVRPQPVGTSVNASIAKQVNLLWAIDKKIRALAAQREAGGAPTELDIRGVFNTTVTLAGNIRNPQVNFQFQGDNWDWSPQPAFATIVRALGLVISDTQTIPIDDIAIEGRLQNGLLQIEPARVQIRDSIVTFAGGFRPATQTLIPSELVVQNLSLDTVNTFVKLPVDVAGNVRAKANLSGKLLSPNIKGNFTFADGALNGRSLDRTIVGGFNYTNSRLEARTTAPESILIYAS